MKVNIYQDYEILSRSTADLIKDYISTKPNSLICLAWNTARHFQCLVNDARSGLLTFAMYFVSLDEWVGIPAQMKGSCRHDG
jgi:6-phosphogluconolactonase/glucosamine-6-phosphate isomerase/deaminase